MEVSGPVPCPGPFNPGERFPGTHEQRKSGGPAGLVWALHRVSYFKTRHYFQNEVSDTYAFDINLAIRGSTVNDVTGCRLVDRLPFMAKLEIFLLHGQR